MKKRTASVLKWIGISVIALGVLYTILLVASNRSLRLAYAALESDGRPLKAAQIIPADIPDTDNAALIYEAIVLQLKAEPAGEENLFSELSTLARKLLKATPEAREKTKFKRLSQTPVALEALAALQKATAKTGCRYDLDYSKGGGRLLPHLADLLNLSRILCALALLQAEDGDYAASWQTVLSSLRLANATKNEPIFNSYLVRIAQFGIARETLHALAAIAPPSIRQYEELDRVLMAFESITPLITLMDGERLLIGEWGFNLPRSELQTVIHTAYNTPNVIILGVLFSPFFQRDHATYLAIMRANARNATKPYSSSDADLEKDQIRNLPSYCILTRMIVPDLSMAKPLTLSMIAQARVIRAGLAALKYRQDKGTYPEGLLDLDMDDLLDPFTNKALIYQVTPAGFTVYSIGENLIDDKGMVQTERHSGDVVWRYLEENKAEPEH